MLARFIGTLLAMNLFTCAALADTLGSNATDIQFTTPPFAIPLMGHKDQFYSTSVLIGTLPNGHDDQFMLTFDMRYDGFVVADVNLDDGVRRSTFDWRHSTTFHRELTYGNLLEGTDNATFRMTLHEPYETKEKLEVDVVLDHDPSSGFGGFIQPFFAQPNDGLFFYRTPDQWPYTILLQKTCEATSALVPAGSITYGDLHVDDCGAFSTLTMSVACTVPVLNISLMAFGTSGSKWPMRAAVLTVPDIALPQEIFNNVAKILGVQRKGDAYVVNCTEKPIDKLWFYVEGDAYYLEYAYLVDRIGADCVLRMRPMGDTEGNDLCESLCSTAVTLGTCQWQNFDVVLGLPFLHRYCVRYDEKNHITSLADQTPILSKLCRYEPDPETPTEQTTTLSTSSTTTTHSSAPTSTASITAGLGVPGRRTTSATPPGDVSRIPIMTIVGAALGGLAVLLIVVGVLAYWVKRQRKRRFVHVMGSLVPRPNLTGWASDGEGHVRCVSGSDDWLRICQNDLVISEEKQIGCGAFAKVFLGELRNVKSSDRKGRLQPGRTSSNGWTKVAVKQARLATDQAREDMQRELELMKDVGSHTHVVNLLGYVPLASPLIVLEFCANGDLLAYLRAHLQAAKAAVTSAKEELQTWAYANTAVTLKDLISLCWQISDGMTFLSSKGYIHRDLAARNILLTEDMVAKISDFGLCRFTNEALYITQHGGKLPIRWMAPETLSTANFSTASDVWSYGVLLYEIFSAGNMPYMNLHPEGILRFVQDGNRLEQPQLCPADVYELMLECWSEQAADRPAFEEIRSFLSLRLEYLSQGYGYLSLDEHAA